MSDLAPALVAASPWLVAPVLAAWRVRDSRRLDEWPAELPGDAPLVSAIVPARDERHNIERCARSLLASSYVPLEVIVVDDHSSDGTGDLARAIARHDPRLRVLPAPPLPEGWFGKPWACAKGAEVARGAILCFVDADTMHAPDLVPRAVNAMRARGLGMLSVIGRQELGSFWERVVQPHVFAVIALRYGGTEPVNRSRRAADKIANGQCIFVTRAAYDSVGGHAVVRDKVAEDLALAQCLFAAGVETALVLGPEQLVTRMYTSLAELVRGWGKNVFAGGREAMPLGMAGRLIFPLLLPLPALATLAPLAGLGLAQAGVGPSWLSLASAIAIAASIIWWLVVYRWMQAPLAYALLFPLGAAVFLHIIIQATRRGSRVAWKEREYVSR